MSNPRVRKLALEKKMKLEKILGSQLDDEEIKKQLGTIVGLYELYDEHYQGLDSMSSNSSGGEAEEQEEEDASDSHRSTSGDSSTTTHNNINNSSINKENNNNNGTLLRSEQKVPPPLKLHRPEGTDAQSSTSSSSSLSSTSSNIDGSSMASGEASHYQSPHQGGMDTGTRVKAKLEHIREEKEGMKAALVTLFSEHCEDHDMLSRFETLLNELEEQVAGMTTLVRQLDDHNKNKWKRGHNNNSASSSTSNNNVENNKNQTSTDTSPGTNSDQNAVMEIKEGQAKQQDDKEKKDAKTPTTNTATTEVGGGTTSMPGIDQETEGPMSTPTTPTSPANSSSSHSTGASL